VSLFRASVRLLVFTGAILWFAPAFAQAEFTPIKVSESQFSVDKPENYEVMRKKGGGRYTESWSDRRSNPKGPSLTMYYERRDQPFITQQTFEPAFRKAVAALNKRLGRSDAETKFGSLSPTLRIATMPRDTRQCIVGLRILDEWDNPEIKAGAKRSLRVTVCMYTPADTVILKDTMLAFIASLKQDGRSFTPAAATNTDLEALTYKIFATR